MPSARNEMHQDAVLNWHPCAARDAGRPGAPAARTATGGERMGGGGVDGSVFPMFPVLLWCGFAAAEMRTDACGENWGVNLLCFNPSCPELLNQTTTEQQQQQQQPQPPPLHPPAGALCSFRPPRASGPPWTRFRHANMNIASEKISPLHTAFRPRQRRADIPPIARWDPRAAKFLAIRASQPPVSSRAACARYRLGRKTADRHNALMRRFDRLRRDLTEHNTTILRLYDTHTILPPSILANVIHDVERASSLYRTLRAAAAVDIIPEDISLPSTLLHGSLKPSTPPCVPSSTPVDFFGG
ncbi:hypothetical protein B0H16DRAFT_1684839 [Mycena metata]|uniref:Uncharacterized protein n=1 Tax=Mycena metata TaxID=1033252 RepID=A0AAD7JXC9_9AGAR|nr:hypothetical protein B0H16DRAFT_1684839 [Mycena metata]